MPRDSNGNYSLPPGYLAVTGQTILATQHNGPLEDIAQALTGSYPRNGSAPMLADLAMGGKKITGLGNGTADTDGVARGQVMDIVVAAIIALAAKTTPADLDRLLLIDSAASNAPKTVTVQALRSLFASLVSTDAGALAGPNIDLYRDSASPAASDLIGSILFNGEDSAGNKELYAAIQSQILDPTSTSEDGALAFRTAVAGALADRLLVKAGVYLAGATGGDPGTGKFNATELQTNGVRVPTINETIGIGQTWQTPTRVGATSYQNTTGRPIQVIISGQTGGLVQVSADNVNWITIGELAGSDRNTVGMIVPNTWHYKTSSTGFSYWTELR